MSLRERLCLLTAAIALLTQLPTPSARADADVTLAIIVAPSSKLSSISMSDLGRVYLSERLSDPDGNKLIPFNHPPKTVDRV
ncbi:MAG TPA: hypothetical protein VGP93_03530, partial [Polyangiaceae bacterium]|nr:hypothetical protein [Polyangiaceae bacterium]